MEPSKRHFSKWEIFPLLYMNVKRIHYSRASQASSAMEFSSFSVVRMAGQILSLSPLSRLQRQVQLFYQIHHIIPPIYGSIDFSRVSQKNSPLASLGSISVRPLGVLMRIPGTSEVAPTWITGTILSVTELCKFLNVSKPRLLSCWLSLSYLPIEIQCELICLENSTLHKDISAQ